MKNVISLKIAFLALVMLAGVQSAIAQSIRDALASAYVYNPQLNAARAALRVTNESVPQALAGYRPTITFNADIGQQHNINTTAQGSQSTTGAGRQENNQTPGGYSFGLNQTLFNGFLTDNQVRQAEALVRAQRETLRTAEQDVMLAAVTAFMDTVRDQAILKLQKSNVVVLMEQLRQTRDRFNVGEVTRTDVAQSESRLQAAIAQVAAAEATLIASKSNYRRQIGRDPGNLDPQTPVEKTLPKSLNVSLEVGASEHPQVRAAAYNVDSAAFAIQIAEAALYPTITVTGTTSTGFNRAVGNNTFENYSVVGRVTVPIYEGGIAPSRIRAAKETHGQNRIQVDAVRDQIRALVASTWGNLESQRAQVNAAQAQIKAAQIAFQSIKEEARVGQRTILDVLNTQQDLLNAQVALVRAQHDRTVAAYTLLGAVGRLSAEQLQLPVAVHDPTKHYEQVRDRWHGLRTPAGE